MNTLLSIHTFICILVVCSSWTLGEDLLLLNESFPLNFGGSIGSNQDSNFLSNTLWTLKENQECNNNNFEFGINHAGNGRQPPTNNNSGTFGYEINQETFFGFHVRPPFRLSSFIRRVQLNDNLEGLVLLRVSFDWATYNDENSMFTTSLLYALVTEESGPISFSTFPNGDWESDGPVLQWNVQKREFEDRISLPTVSNNTWLYLQWCLTKEHMNDHIDKFAINNIQISLHQQRGSTSTTGEILTTSSGTSSGTSDGSTSSSSTTFLQESTIPTDSRNLNSQDETNTNLIVGVSLGGFIGLVVFLLFLIICLFLRRRTNEKMKKKKEIHEPSEVPMEQHDTVYSSMSGEHSDQSPESKRKSNNYRKSDVFLIKSEEIILKDQLGEGAFGRVFSGEWRNMKVAVKEIKSQNLEDEIILNDFLTEADVMRNIKRHTNIVTFLGVCQSPLWIVTELCEKGALSKLLKDELFEMPLELKIQIIKDICNGMTHLSLEGIIHKDLAARNVLITSTLKAKIGDFGLSRFKPDEGSEYISSRNEGPVKWLAPECLKKRTYSEKSDIWAFGVTCIEILTREKPYPQLTGAEFAMLVFSKKLSLIPYIPEDTPIFLQEIIVECFEEDPTNRPNFEMVQKRLAEGAFISMQSCQSQIHELAY